MNVISLNIRGIGNHGKADWVRRLRTHNEVNFLMLQETQCTSLDTVNLGRFWGVGEFIFDWVSSTGRSGGLLSIWDPQVFVMDRVVKNPNWLLVSGVIKGSGCPCHVLNVYAPQNLVAKRVLWTEIIGLVGEGVGRWIVAGDFNSVRSAEDRRNSSFNVVEANEFNDFIDAANLHEYSLKGRRFTFVAERYKSDHSPLLLKMGSRNFGPKPFRFYNSWLGRDDFGTIVRSTLEDGSFTGNPDSILMTKFKVLRKNISNWVAEVKANEKEERRLLDHELCVLDQALESRTLSEEEVWTLAEIKRRIGELDDFNHRDLKQKARCNWATYGDDNSRYFHGFINKRKAFNHIPGLEVNGRWETNPIIIKREVMGFFRYKFKESLCNRPKLVCYGLSTLNLVDAEGLVAEFSEQEIKRAVFDCGADKAPGPDGFNFRFIRHFWDLFETDFVDILGHFH
ncbi:uncharacterized protein LOC110914058 [Helianthus annuus]|uniref:uncharacterized protein LOC110914058 n=1 Tax=Helianthus annuus TaxID=4232 RepID=UPI000B8F4A5A|nr:uncharacterized protein LOC110914058 [Helianthus annuus]